LLVKNASRIVPENLEMAVEALCYAAAKNDTNTIMLILEHLVPGYKPKYLHNSLPEKALKNSTVVEKTNITSLPYSDYHKEQLIK